jgi:hypothetical protein
VYIRSRISLLNDKDMLQDLFVTSLGGLIRYIGLFEPFLLMPSQNVRVVFATKVLGYFRQLQFSRVSQVQTEEEDGWRRQNSMANEM